MAFLCTFSGLSGALVIWFVLYNFASVSQNPSFLALAPYLEATSVSGWCFFLILTATISWFTFLMFRPKNTD